MKMDSKILFMDYLKPYFGSDTRHLMQGETFMFKGLQFKVVAVRRRLIGCCCCIVCVRVCVPTASVRANLPFSHGSWRCLVFRLQCVPQNGVVDRNTEIFTEGEPLRDLEKLQILPIYETCVRILCYRFVSFMRVGRPPR